MLNANLVHLFNDYIKVSDNQESVLKIINATKLLNEEISKVASNMIKHPKPGCLWWQRAYSKLEEYRKYQLLNKSSRRTRYKNQML